MLVAINKVQAVVDSVEHSWQVRELPDVVEAAISIAPKWVITMATENALHIIEAGNSQKYADAARWLKQVKRAYTFLGKTADWSGFYMGLSQKHSRKRKLMAEFEAIGL